MSDDLTPGEVRALFPSAALDIIGHYRGAGDAEAWGIGDLSADLVDEFAGRVIETPEGKKRITKTAIRIAIADEWGNTDTTVKDYEYTARYYELKHRRYDNLTWSHYRQARAAGDLKVSLGYLREASESADDWGGRAMPVRVLAAKMKTNGHVKASTIERLINVLRNIVGSLLVLDIPDELRAWLEAMPESRD